MTNLTPEGQTIVNDVATRHGFSPDAVTHVLVALDQGGPPFERVLVVLVRGWDVVAH